MHCSVGHTLISFLFVAILITLCLLKTFSLLVRTLFGITINVNMVWNVSFLVTMLQHEMMLVRWSV